MAGSSCPGSVYVMLDWVSYLYRGTPTWNIGRSQYQYAGVIVAYTIHLHQAEGDRT